MVVYCCVLLCKSRGGNKSTKDIRFHEIPSSATLREKWLAAIPTKGSKWVPTDYTRVCSLHFRKEDYRENAKRNILKPGVLPSIFTSYLQARNTNPLTGQGASEKNDTVFKKNDTCIDKMSSQKNEVPEVSTENKRDIGIQVNIITKEYNAVTLRREISRLHSLIFRQKKNIANLEKKLNDLQQRLEKNPEYGEIDAIKEAAAKKSQKAVYLLDQISNFGKSMPEWSELSIQYSMAWRIVSPKGYEHTRFLKLISAPSRSTLDRYIGGEECDIGISPLIKRLKAESENLQSMEKVVSIIPDEMSIKERLQCDRTSDQFYGVVNDEHIDRGLKKTEHDKHKG